MAPPTSEGTPGFSPSASQTHTGPSTLSSTAMSAASATGMRRAPAVNRIMPRPSWPVPNRARSRRSPAPADPGCAAAAVTTLVSAAASAAAGSICTWRLRRRITVAIAKASATVKARRSPPIEPAAASV